MALIINITNDGKVTIDKSNREQVVYKVGAKHVETLQTVVHGTITMLIHEAGIEKEKGANNEKY